jgi:hypothetical protein
MSGGQTPVEVYVGIKQAYLGSFGEYQSKTIKGTKMSLMNAHLCPIIVK